MSDPVYHPSILGLTDDVTCITSAEAQPYHPINAERLSQIDRCLLRCSCDIHFRADTPNWWVMLKISEGDAFLPLPRLTWPLTPNSDRMHVCFRASSRLWNILNPKMPLDRQAIWPTNWSMGSCFFLCRCALYECLWSKLSYPATQK